MPAKHTVKSYLENGYYHIYNRGVEKRIIFGDDQDCQIFLGNLKNYLMPFKPSPQKPLPSPGQIDLADQIKLLSFCLMPNHFHLLVWQKTRNGIEKLMRRVGTKYVIYFNKRYKRVGPLFENIYKAVSIESDEQLLHLSRYIHLNPIKDGPLQRTILLEAYSSYKVYLGKQRLEWVNSEKILSFFKTAKRISLKDIFSYQNFVEDYKKDSGEGLETLIVEQGPSS